MGVIDAKAHELLRDPEEFSRLVNAAAFGGNPVVKADCLQEVNSVTTLAKEDGEHGQGRRRRGGDVSIRDLLKPTVLMLDGARMYMLLGVENQASVDYGMPLRLLHYDIELYMRQMRDAKARRKRRGGKGSFTSDFGPDDRLDFAISIVVYYGDRPWDGPTELSDMFRDIPDDIADYVRPFLPSYRIKVVSPQSPDAELDMLGPGLRAVLYYARHAHDAAGLERMLESHPDLRTPTPNAASLISSLMNVELNIEEQKENVDMWTVLEDAKRIGRDEGIAQGKAEGIAQGKAEGISEVICNMFQSGMKLSDISRVTRISRSRLRRMVSANHTTDA